jgi:hypothetical protein
MESEDSSQKTGVRRQESEDMESDDRSQKSERRRQESEEETSASVTSLYSVVFYNEPFTFCLLSPVFWRQASGRVEAGVLFLVSVAFVLQFVVNPNLRSVVSPYRSRFELPKESLLRFNRLLLVLRDPSQ